MYKYQVMSPVDELRHLDYAIRITEGELPKLGDKLEGPAMRTEACRGIDLPGWTNPPCDTPKFNPPQFRDDGWQTASPHPPTYYAVAGVVGKTLRSLGITNSILDGARLVSGIFLALGLIATLLLAREFGMSDVPVLSVLTMIMVFPSLLHSSSIVTPDSLSMFVAATLGVTTLKWLKGHISLRAVCIASAFVGFSKLTNLLAVALFAVFVYFAHRSTFETARDQRATRLAAGAILISGSIPSFVWITFDRLRATIDPMVVPQNIQLAHEGFPPLSSLIMPGNILAWLPPYGSYFYTAFISQGVLTMTTLVVGLFLGGMFASILRFDSREPMSLFATTTATLAIVGAPALITATAVTSGVLVGAAPRYGLSLLPAMVVIVASHIRGRTGTSIAVVIALTTYIVVGTGMWFA